MTCLCCCRVDRMPTDNCSRHKPVPASTVPLAPGIRAYYCGNDLGEGRRKRDVIIEGDVIIDLFSMNIPLPGAPTFVSDALARAHVDEAGAVRRCDRKRSHPAAPEDGLHRRVVRRRKLEAHVPRARPGPKRRAVCITVVRGLEQYPVQGRVHVREVVRGRLVVLLVWGKCREAVAASA